MTDHRRIADVSPPEVDLAQAPDFEVGALRVRPSLREVQGVGEAERLEPRVMKALVALAARPGEVLSREALTDRCWNGQVVGDDAINRCMAKLRQVGRAHAAFEIEAVPRVGYRLTPAGGPGRAARPPRRWALAALALATVALAAVGGAVLLRPAALSAGTPFAVEPFRAATADPASRAFAATAGSEVAAAIDQAQLRTVAARAWGRRLVVDGLVDGDTAQVHVRVRLRDPASGVTLWTADFAAPPGEAAALRAQVAARAAGAAQATQEALRCKSRDLDPTALGLWVQSVDGVTNNTWSSLTAAQALVRRAPDFGPGHGMLASNLLASSVLSGQNGPALRAQAVAEARRAAIQPGCGDPFNILSWASDVRQWGARERLLAHSPEPDSYLAKSARGGLLLRAGRLAEGQVLVGQAINSHRAAPAMAGDLVSADRALGNPAEAARHVRQFLAIRPTDVPLRAQQLAVTALDGDPRAGLALTEDPVRRPPHLGAAGLDAYRAFLRWRITPNPASRADAVAATIAAAHTRPLLTGEAVSILAVLGDLDAAFAIADAWAADPRTWVSAQYFDPTFLFAPQTAAMRADPRFVPLVKALGLLDYWRESSRGPDFCQTETAPVCALL